MHDFMPARSVCLILETVLYLSFFYNGSGCIVALNPLPALTYQTVLDLNAACRSKRTGCSLRKYMALCERNIA